MIATRRLRGAIATALVMVVLMPNPGRASEYQAPVNEYILLPKFCWSQFADNFTGPEYTILGCGAGMNHYCSGLHNLQRAKKERNPNERRADLVRARENTLYTIKWMKQQNLTETCPIAPHVQATMREIDFMFKMYGLK